VDTGITFAIILAGIPAYLLWRRFGGTRHDPVTGDHRA
jgi:CII-binding regulator of phage lambda lysogenization HflD